MKDRIKGVCEKLKTMKFPDRFSLNTSLCLRLWGRNLPKLRTKGKGDFSDHYLPLEIFLVGGTWFVGGFFSHPKIIYDCLWINVDMNYLKCHICYIFMIVLICFHWISLKIGERNDSKSKLILQRYLLDNY